jgi:hypothetical protein
VTLHLTLHLTLLLNPPKESDLHLQGLFALTCAKMTKNALSRIEKSQVGSLARERRNGLLRYKLLEAFLKWNMLGFSEMCGESLSLPLSLSRN